MKLSNEKTSAGLTVDIKRTRIRIHKNTLSLMNNPNYLRLLINPQTKCIIVENCNETSSGAHRIKTAPSCHHGYFEICSSSLVHEIADCAGFHEYTTVKLLGKRIRGQDAVFFRMESAHQNLSHRKGAK